MMDLIIGMHKIKYSTLDDIMKLRDDCDIVNLFIDVHTIISKIYRKTENTEWINTGNNNDMFLAIDLLNLAAHYRRYLYKKGKSNRIFFVFDNKIPRYQSELISYGNIYFDRYSEANIAYRELNEFVERVMSNFHKLCVYFEDISFIKTSGIDDSVKIQYLINKFSGQNFIMSKYEHMFQLINNDNTEIILPNRDNSYIINRNNLYDNILDKLKFRPSHVDYQIFNIYLTVQGLKCRDVPSMSIRGRVKVLQLLDYMISEEFITNTVSLKTFSAMFKDVMRFDDEEVAVMERRYKALNAKLGAMALSSSEKSSIDNQIFHLFDRDKIEALNNKLPSDKQISFLDLYKNKVVTKRKEMRWD